jgi:kynurenine formamidase
MTYVISNIISVGLPGLWAEGSPYFKSNIYRIEEGKLPPVNYDSHQIKPHSITHVETLAHVDKTGNTIDYFIKNHIEYFFGNCLLIKLKPDYKELSVGLFQHEVSLGELVNKIEIFGGIKQIPGKVLLTTENYHENKYGFHDENYILTLSIEAAQFLTDIPQFHLFGTSWKSCDYQPGKADRPIHKILLNNGIAYELLKLNHVPEGFYYFTGIPLYLENASESPVTPVLIDNNHIIL